MSIVTIINFFPFRSSNLDLGLRCHHPWLYYMEYQALPQPRAASVVQDYSFVLWVIRLHYGSGDPGFWSPVP